MQPQAVRQMLKQEIDTLPDTLAESVYDFVLFIKTRHNEEVALWEEVQATQAYREQHPEDVQTVTAEEWERATAHLE
jgi:hypothetical protein